MKTERFKDVRLWTCWCCKKIFWNEWDVFKKHLDECELKVVANPEEYDEAETSSSIG